MCAAVEGLAARGPSTQTLRSASAASKRGKGGIDELARRIVRGERITLLCSSACTDPARRHRTLIALVQQAHAR
jgi:hypothetical protein